MAREGPLKLREVSASHSTMAAIFGVVFWLVVVPAILLAVAISAALALIWWVVLLPGRVLGWGRAS